MHLADTNEQIVIVRFNLLISYGTMVVLGGSVGLAAPSTLQGVSRCIAITLLVDG